ncbi:MAG: YidB family protein [Dokdonella sp.]
MLDPLIREVDERFALGDTAPALLTELLTLIFNGRNGGVPGLMAKFRNQGFGDLFESWLAHASPRPIEPQQLERIFGSGTLSAMADRLGVSRSATTAAACTALPKLIGLLTRGGKLPTSLPGDFSRYLSRRYSNEASLIAAKSVRIPSPRESHVDVNLTPGLGWIKWVLLATCLIALGYCMVHRRPAAIATTPSTEVTTPGAAALTQSKT